MSDFTVDMATWYPLLPYSGDLDIEHANTLSAIRGIQVNVILDAAQEIQNIALQTDMLRLQLSAVDTVTLYYQYASLNDNDMVTQRTYRSINIPLRVHQGLDTPPIVNGESYIILSDAADLSAINTVLQNHLFMVHPDCLVLYKEAPSLQLFGYESLDKDGNGIGNNTDGDGITIPVLSAGDTSQDQLTYFLDGYNCNMSVSQSGITITGGPGLGLGIIEKAEDVYYFDEEPDAGDPDAVHITDSGILINPAGKGLRSINGLTKDVQIKGHGSVTLQTSIDATELNHTISLTLTETNEDAL